MKKIFLIPNAITAFGLTCGLFVIFKTSIANPARDLFSLLQASAILLLIAALADLADGAVARLIKAESDFGKQFDSLSDAVIFGVAPPLLILKSLTGSGGVSGGIYTFIIILSTMIYSLCGVLRLVRFNVQSTQERGEKKHFTGLPIPAAASAALSTSLVLLSPFITQWLPLSPDTRAIILTCVLLFIGYLMVSRWKFPSAKALHFRVPSLYLVFVVGIIAVIVLYGILDYFAEAYFVVSWLYLLISITLSVIRMIAGKRSKTLADFEPENEDSNE